MRWDVSAEAIRRRMAHQNASLIVTPVRQPDQVSNMNEKPTMRRDNSGTYMVWFMCLMWLCILFGGVGDNPRP